MDLILVENGGCILIGGNWFEVLEINIRDINSTEISTILDEFVDFALLIFFSGSRREC